MGPSKRTWASRSSSRSPRIPRHPNRRKTTENRRLFHLPRESDAGNVQFTSEGLTQSGTGTLLRRAGFQPALLHRQVENLPHEGGCLSPIVLDPLKTSEVRARSLTSLPAECSPS